MLPSLEPTQVRQGAASGAQARPGLPLLQVQVAHPGRPCAARLGPCWSFGLVVALICTRATLTAVQEEKEVVQLAQELVAREAAVGGFWPALGYWQAICLRQTA